MKGHLQGHQTQIPRTQAGSGGKSGGTGFQAEMDRRPPADFGGDRDTVLNGVPAETGWF